MFVALSCPWYVARSIDSNPVPDFSLAPGCMPEARVLDNWLPFLIYGTFALAIPASMIVMSIVLATRPQRRTRARGTPFESGVSTGPPRQQRFTVSFYLTAMLFIVFDIEIVFLYPLAVVLESIGWFAFLEFLFFIAILVIAYVYVWRKGALEWQ
jgi:NADH-quinone oxidoreductase subunit A